MYKTIKELSKEIGVTVQAIHQVKNKLLENEKLNKRGNSFILNTKQQAIIKEHFNVEDVIDNSSALNEASNTLKQYNDFLKEELDRKNMIIHKMKEKNSESKEASKTVKEYIDTLKKELEIRNKQIEEMNIQMNQLHILLLKEKDSNRLVEAKEVTKHENYESKKNEKKRKTDKFKKKKWYEIFKINND